MSEADEDGGGGGEGQLSRADRKILYRKWAVHGQVRKAPRCRVRATETLFGSNVRDFDCHRICISDMCTKGSGHCPRVGIRIIQRVLVGAQLPTTL